MTTRNIVYEFSVVISKFKSYINRGNTGSISFHIKKDLLKSVGPVKSSVVTNVKRIHLNLEPLPFFKSRFNNWVRDIVKRHNLFYSYSDQYAILLPDVSGFILINHLSFTYLLNTRR